MESKLVITNNYYCISKELSIVINNLQYPDLNYEKVTTKIPVEELISKINSTPCFDSLRVILLEVIHFTKKELKTIAEAIKNSKTTIVICVYYTKDKLDKGDVATIKLFQALKINVVKNLGINVADVRNMLSGLNINTDLFINADNMDVVKNDIDKIKCLDDLSNAKKYITKSFESNIFDLINFIISRNINSALETLRFLLSKENPVSLNLVLLKHFNSLREIKMLLEDLTLEEVNIELTKRKKILTGKGSAMHPYRLKLLANDSLNTKIDLNYAVNELLNNDTTKKFDLELSLLKIMGKR